MNSPVWIIYSTQYTATHTNSDVIEANSNGTLKGTLKWTLKGTLKETLGHYHGH